MKGFLDIVGFLKVAGQLRHDWRYLHLICIQLFDCAPNLLMQVHSFHLVQAVVQVFLDQAVPKPEAGKELSINSLDALRMN